MAMSFAQIKVHLRNLDALVAACEQEPVIKGHAEPQSESQFIKSMGSLAAVTRTGRRDYVGLKMWGGCAKLRSIRVVLENSKRFIEFRSNNQTVLSIPVLKKVQNYHSQIKYWLLGHGDAKSLKVMLKING